MIPGYRIRIYCFIGALFCLLCSWLVAEQIYNALTLWQFDSTTGPRWHRMKEHFVYDEQPWRFGLYLLRDVAFFISASGAGLVLSWGVLRGRRAFHRWRAK
ncbi:hypothetical protein DKY63_31505 [Pseudomonas putida]|uniref:Uncharacterized protein n=1 Tax=Pseudomonas putida TaxID=303 RepID=A0A2Z4RWL7_PSEPU|nr:hypothetical protein DKY63_31505 [Pseudomonas putida]